MVFYLAGFVFVVSAIIVYMAIGAWIGRLSLRVWRHGYRNTLFFLLFPVSAYLDVGSHKDLPPFWSFIAELGVDEDRYVPWMIYIWPLKVAWNVVWIALVSVFYPIHRARRAFVRGNALTSRVKEHRRLRRQLDACRRELEIGREEERLILERMEEIENEQQSSGARIYHLPTRKNTSK